MDKISLIIPTYNEKENISNLLKKLITEFKTIKADYEIVVVDDNSPDGTGKIVDTFSQKNKRILIIHRGGKNGLSSAVIDGIRKSSGNIICVMDADFSHPPEKIKELFNSIKGGKDLVIGSRHVRGGKILGWNMKRKAMSKFATILARPLTKAKDPMSGFFMFKKNIINLEKINAKGFKILLEVLIKGKHKNMGEVPIVFINRKEGKSKASMKEIVFYLQNLFGYYLENRIVRQIAKFLVVGASGVVINLLVYYLSYLFFNLSYVYSSIIAFLFALTSNYLINKTWTFSERLSDNFVKKYAKFFGISLLAFCVQFSLLIILSELGGWSPIISQPVSILISTIINFYGNKKWTFKK